MVKQSLIFAAPVAVIVSAASAIYPPDSRLVLEPGFDTREENGRIVYTQGMMHKKNCAESVANEGQQFFDNPPSHVARLTSDFNESSIVVMVTTEAEDNLNPIIIVEYLGEPGKYYCSQEVHDKPSYENAKNLETEVFYTNPPPSSDEAFIDSTNHIDSLSQGVYKVWVENRDNLEKTSHYDLLVAEEDDFKEFLNSD